MNNFLKDASKYARNPLGIIALALVFTYATACSTFYFCKDLPDYVIVCLTIFVILYPVVVIIMFYLLVALHHTKLYSPRDFPRPGDFMGCAYGDKKTAMKKKTINKTESQTPEGK